MTSFRIGARVVGGDAPVFIVAELSANHGQRKDVALRTIEAAARAGADAIKLQTYTPDTITLKSNAPPFVVRTENEWDGRTLYDLYKEAMTPWEWHAELMQAAEAAGLLCFSTPFDATAVALLEQLGVVAHKVASFELTDLPLVERIARTGKPMILSTGMASLGEIEAAVAICRGAGNERLALLRCVSTYPAHAENMNLASLAVLGSMGVVVGLSDHTRESTVAVAAVALGAKIVEKHFIVDRSLGGPDAFFSLDPGEFRAMVGAVRDAEKAIGKARFGPSPDEVASIAYRRSLFATTDVTAGEVFTCDSVRSVRPAHGIPARHLPSVLGRVATCSIPRATPLAWEMVGSHPATTSVRLRAFARDDAERLGSWLDDSFMSTAPPGSTILVAEVDDRPIGVVRFDPHGSNEAEISLALAPASRGKRLATSVLLAAEALAATLGHIRLVARILARHETAVRAFKKAGYYGFVDSSSPEGALVTCERRVARYS